MADSVSDQRHRDARGVGVDVGSDIAGVQRTDGRGRQIADRGLQCGDGGVRLEEVDRRGGVAQRVRGPRDTAQDMALLRSSHSSLPQRNSRGTIDDVGQSSPMTRQLSGSRTESVDIDDKLWPLDIVVRAKRRVFSATLSRETRSIWPVVHRRMRCSALRGV